MQHHPDIGCNYVNIDGFGIPIDSCITTQYDDQGNNTNDVSIKYHCNETWSGLKIEIYPNSRCIGHPLNSSTVDKSSLEHDDDILGFICNDIDHGKQCKNSILMQLPVNDYNHSQDIYYPYFLNNFSLITNICLLNNDNTYLKFKSLSSCHNTSLSIYNTSSGNCTKQYLIDTISINAYCFDHYDDPISSKVIFPPIIICIILSLFSVLMIIYIITIYYKNKRNSKVGYVKYDNVSGKTDYFLAKTNITKSYKDIIDVENGIFYWKLNHDELAYLITFISGNNISSSNPPKLFYKTFAMYDLNWFITIYDIYNNQNALISLSVRTEKFKKFKILYSFEFVEIGVSCTHLKQLSSADKKYAASSTINFTESMKKVIDDLLNMYHDDESITVKCQMKIMEIPYPTILSNGQSFKLQWKIDRFWLDKFKAFNDKDSFESPLFYNLFLLRIYPNRHDNGYPAVVVINICYKIAQNLQWVGTLKCHEEGLLYSDIKPMYEMTERTEGFIFSKPLKLLTKIEEFTDTISLEFDCKFTSNYAECQYLDRIGQLKDYDQEKKVSLIQYFLSNCCKESVPFIPRDIIFLIALFYPKLNGNIIKWDIKNEPILLNTLFSWNSEITRGIKSQIFNVANMDWTICLFPQIRNYQHRIQSKLTLLYLPKYILSLTVNFRLIIEFKNKYDELFVIRYTKIGIIKHDKGSRDLYSCNIHYPVLQQLKSMKFIKSFSISYLVNILEIRNNIRNIDQEIIYKYRDPLEMNERRLYEIDWKIENKFEINAIQNGGRPKIYFESDIFYNMWCMRLLIDNGTFRLYLQLCSLPTNIEEININIKLDWYSETDHGELTKMSKVLNYKDNYVRFSLPSNGAYRKFKMSINIKDPLQCLTEILQDTFNTAI